MLITSSAGDFIELRIGAYQYSKSQAAPDGGWDENWLHVSGRVKRGNESWAFREPCLTTWDAQNLLAWLRRIHSSTAESIDFTEPNLSFDAHPTGGDEVTIVITFKGESAPPSIADEDRWSVGCAMTFRVSEGSLAAAADSWERELAAFPVR